MSDNFIGVDISGEKELIVAMRKLPDALVDAGVEDANAYLLNVMRTYPPYKYVSRKEAYPEVRGWFSDKQRRWFFAALARGEIQIPYRRTQTLSRGWELLGTGKNQLLVNEVPYGGYVMGDGTQSRHEHKAGWKTINTILGDRMPQILKAFMGGAKRAARKLGIKIT